MNKIQTLLNQRNFLEASFLLTAVEDIEQYLPLFLEKDQEMLALDIVKKVSDTQKKAALQEVIVRSALAKKQFAFAFDHASQIGDRHLQVSFFIDFFDRLLEKKQHDKALYYLSKMQNKKVLELIAKRFIRYAIDEQNLDLIEDVLRRSSLHAPWYEKTVFFVSKIRKKSFKFEPSVLQIVFKEFPNFKEFILFSRRISDWIQ